MGRRSNRCGTHRGIRSVTQNSVSVSVLGIDPGIASTGYGVVGHRQGRMAALDGGVIRTDSKLALERRLTAIHRRVRGLIAEHQPSALAAEDIFFGVNARTAFAVGQARGVVMLAAGEAGIPCFTYTPQAIKKSVCGSGQAEKGQIQRMVQRLLSLSQPPHSDHAADALAVAICHSSIAGAFNRDSSHTSGTAVVQ